MTDLAVIFDLDGTLIDSLPDLRAALNRVLASRGLPALTDDAVRPMIGDGARMLVARAWAAYGLEAGAADLADFLADYEANATVETVIYPGMTDALAELAEAGHKMGICTNKPTAAAEIIVERLGLKRHFAAVTGGDATPYRKPDPRHLQGAIAALDATRAVMIGDHANDMAAANGLGLPSIFVTWGYGQAQGSFRADRAAELPEIIAGI